MKRLMLAAIVMSVAALAMPGAMAGSHECEGAWVTATLGPSQPAVGGSCEASLAGATAVSGEVEALVGTTLGGSMSGTVTLEIRNAADDSLLASCTNQRVSVPFGDWADGDRPSCSASASVSGVTAITCTVVNGVRIGTYGCSLS